MIICISGLSGTGKNTAGELLAKQLGCRQIQFTFKDEAKARGISLMELQKLADKNPGLDKEFDERLVREASKGNCVVTTWLGPWMVKKPTCACGSMQTRRRGQGAFQAGTR